MVVEPFFKSAVLCYKKVLNCFVIVLNKKFDQKRNWFINSKFFLQLPTVRFKWTIIFCHIFSKTKGTGVRVIQRVTFKVKLTAYFQYDYHIRLCFQCVLSECASCYETDERSRTVAYYSINIMYISGTL